MLSTRPVRIEGHAPNMTNVKTPGRAILKGRGALQENALHRAGAMSGNGKGKKVVMNSPSQLKTHHPQRTLKDSVLGKSTSIILTRPLGDKTPFRNRVEALHTPLPNGSKISKLSLGVSQLQTPGLLRPSSARKHDRMPSASKNFQTPHTQGNHWDVSDTEIEGPEAVVINQSIEEEDFQDIEYMPPSVIEETYQPPFEMPNYADVGRAMKTLVHSYHFDDPPTFDSEPEPIILDKFAHDLSLPELEDDSPFYLAKAMSRPPSKDLGRNLTAASRSTRPTPVTRPTSRVGATKTGPTSASSSRPGTAAAVRTRVPPIKTGLKAPVTSKATAVDATRKPAALNRPFPAGNKPILVASQPRRPATSASTYRAITTSSTVAARRPGTSLRVAPGRRLSTKAKAPAHNDVVLNFETTALASGILVDDFRFDV